MHWSSLVLYLQQREEAGDRAAGQSQPLLLGRGMVASAVRSLLLPVLLWLLFISWWGPSWPGLPRKKSLRHAEPVLPFSGGMIPRKRGTRGGEGSRKPPAAPPTLGSRCFLPRTFLSPPATGHAASPTCPRGWSSPVLSVSWGEVGPAPTRVPGSAYCQHAVHLGRAGAWREPLGGESQTRLSVSSTSGDSDCINVVINFLSPPILFRQFCELTGE